MQIQAISTLTVSSLAIRCFSVGFMPPMDYQAGKHAKEWTFVSNPYKPMRLSLRKWLDSFQVFQVKYTQPEILQFMNYISRILFQNQIQNHDCCQPYSWAILLWNSKSLHWLYRQDTQALNDWLKHLKSIGNIFPHL